MCLAGSIDKPPHAEEGYHAAAIHQDSARMDLKRLSSWPRQRAPTTGSGRDSGGAGKIVKQRRVGWASGDASGGESDGGLGWHSPASQSKVAVEGICYAKHVFFFKKSCVILRFSIFCLQKKMCI